MEKKPDQGFINETTDLEARWVEPVSSPNKNSVIKEILKGVASLKITVVLFALSILLVFFGTLAQVDEGVWTVLKSYFRSPWVWVPFQLFVQFGHTFFGVSRQTHISGAFPFPGGWLLGGLLLTNLLAAHLIRFRLSWNRCGILLLHFGLVVMMVGEFVTGMCAIESKMTLEVGETGNFLDVSNKVEFAITDPSNPNSDDVVVIPESILRKKGVIHNDLLPFDIEVLEYMKNSEIITFRQKPGDANDAVLGLDGTHYTVVNQSEESGITSKREDAPAARLTFKEKGTSKPLGTFLVSLWYYANNPIVPRQIRIPPQQISIGSKKYYFELRSRRVYKPYSVHLLKFDHDKYMGTDTPKNFSSLVQLIDPTKGEDREVKIYMNNPLRYSGETFYQSGYIPDKRGTVLQVVRNPGWLMLYFSCLIVALGMILHFLPKLIGFLKLRVAK